MIVAYQAKKGVKDLLPSVVHVDNSVRPQTVEKDVNPRYWSIINELKSLTGHSVVLNTSFNLRGRLEGLLPPFVMTQEEMVNKFDQIKNLLIMIMGQILYLFYQTYPQKDKLIKIPLRQHDCFLQ